MSTVVRCRGCDRPLLLEDDQVGRRVRCPACGTAVTWGKAIRPAPPERPARPPRPRPAQEQGVEEYSLAGKACPQCAREMDKDAVLCLHCGFNLQTGKRHQTTYDRLERRWRYGVPLPTGLALVAGSAFTAVLAVLCFLREAPAAAVALCILLPAATVLLAGNGFEVVLARTSKGKLLVTRRSWVCCIPRPRQTVDLRHYDSVRIAGNSDDGVPSLAFAAFRVLGVMRYGGYTWVSTQPAVNVLYSVRLGAGPEVGPLLFLGMNEHKMHDLVETFREVAGLRIDRL